MKVAFRTDASLDIGIGHVMRCLTLAEALRSHGANCHFICREHPGHLLDHIRKRGFAVSGLHSCKPDEHPLDETGEPPAHAHWLGCDWQTDARQTGDILAELQPDWLVVDHYALDTRWEETLKVYYKKLLVIDDLADRPHACDVLLDQNWFATKTASRYNGLTPPHCFKLLGPQHALLQPEYAQLRALMPPRDGIVRRVLVFLGGSDPTNQTAVVLNALMQSDFEHLVVDVVIGVNHPDPQGIAAMVAARPATCLHQNLPSLAGLMARADLMIGAGGATSWERMSLGLPSIVISIAENQTPMSLALMKAGYISFVGEMGVLKAGDIANAVRQSLASPIELKNQSSLMQKLVQGSATSQLCERLLTMVQTDATSHSH